MQPQATGRKLPSPNPEIAVAKSPITLIDLVIRPFGRQ